MVSTEDVGVEVAVDVGPAAGARDRDRAGPLADRKALDRLDAHGRRIACARAPRRGPGEGSRRAGAPCRPGHPPDGR